MQVIGYYTPDYRGEANRLAVSLQRLRLDYTLTPVPDLGRWHDNAQFKPRFLRQLREQVSGPLLYIDADAVCHSDPWPYLRNIKAGIAVHYHQINPKYPLSHSPDATEELRAGTMLLSDDAATRYILAAWDQMQSEQPAKWDQTLLQTLLSAPQMGPVWRLPVSFTYIFDSSRVHHPGVTPVIEHLQASRAFRPELNTDKAHQRLRARKQRIQEVTRMLCGGDTLPWILDDGPPLVYAELRKDEDTDNA